MNNIICLSVSVSLSLSLSLCLCLSLSHFSYSIFISFYLFNFHYFCKTYLKKIIRYYKLLDIIYKQTFCIIQIMSVIRTI